MHILNILIIIFSILFIIIEFKNAILRFQISKIAVVFLTHFSTLSFFIYINTNNIIVAFQDWTLLTSEVLFVNIISIYIMNLSKEIKIQEGNHFQFFIFFYCASPIAIISICRHDFPNELFLSNCFISFVTLILILKYSISIVMSKEIRKVSVFYQLFLLLILMTGCIFSFANFNYSINIILDTISSNSQIVDYIFLYSSIFTLNYDSLIEHVWTDKLLASISMIYSYFFISTIFTTIITRLNSNN